jgi:hypothetical protein
MSIASWEYDLSENDAENYSMVDRTFMVMIVPVDPAREGRRKWLWAADEVLGSSPSTEEVEVAARDWLRV